MRRHALTIGAVTQARYMPPWKPELGWTAYRDERRLSPAQITLIQQGIAAGAPEGDLAKAPRPPVFTEGWQLGTPDLILELPASFPVPAEGNDIYRNFVLPTNLTEDDAAGPRSFCSVQRIDAELGHCVRGKGRPLGAGRY